MYTVHYGFTPGSTARSRARLCRLLILAHRTLTCASAWATYWWQPFSEDRLGFLETSLPGAVGGERAARVRRAVTQRHWHPAVLSCRAQVHVCTVTLPPQSPQLQLQCANTSACQTVMLSASTWTTRCAATAWRRPPGWVCAARAASSYARSYGGRDASIRNTSGLKIARSCQ